MKKIYSYFIVLSFAVIVVTVVYKMTHRAPVIQTKLISGTVQNVWLRKNTREDGYYGFEVIDKSGAKYTVDATGFSNSFTLPVNAGYICVLVPKVKEGDLVEFSLPSLDIKVNGFETCYKKNLQKAGYFFKISN
jgi:hypothetical protein